MDSIITVKVSHGETTDPLGVVISAILASQNDLAWRGFPITLDYDVKVDV